MPTKAELRMKLEEHKRRMLAVHASSAKEAKKKKSSKKSGSEHLQEPIRTFLVDEEIPVKEDAITEPIE